MKCYTFSILHSRFSIFDFDIRFSILDNDAEVELSSRRSSTRRNLPCSTALVLTPGTMPMI